MNREVGQEAARKRLRRSDLIVAFRAIYAHITGSAVAGLMLSQMRHYADHPSAQCDEEGNRWTSRTRQQWWEETGLGKYEQLNARKKLVALKFIQEKYAKDNTAFFCLDYERVEKAIEDWRNGVTSSANQTSPSSANQTSLPRLQSRLPSSVNQTRVVCEADEPSNIESIESKEIKVSLSKDLHRDESARTPDIAGERDQPKTFKQVFRGAPLPEELPGTPERTNPSPAKGALDPRELAQQIWIAYPKNAHLQPFEVSPAAIVQLLPILREEAKAAGTTQTEAALEIISLIGEIAAAVKGDTEQQKYLPAPEKFFAQRQYRLKSSHFTRSNGGKNGANQATTSPAITRAERSRDAIRQATAELKRDLGLLEPADGANEGELSQPGDAAGHGKIVDGKLDIARK